MATTKKITISVSDDLVKQAKRAVREHRAGSVSEYFADCARRRVKEDDLAKLVQEMLAETGGPATDAEIDHVRSLLGKPLLKRRQHR